MRSEEKHRWNKGELYDLLCLSGIAVCLWEIGVRLDLFSIVSDIMVRSGLSSLMCLGFLMCFVLALGSARKSFALRREMMARMEAQAQAHSLARHDPLTGLPNRRVLGDVIAMAGEPGQPPAAILMIDLDRFKSVNDLHGHEAGDVILCRAAHRIRALMPNGATAARLGGDEFAALVPYGTRSDLMRLAEQLVKALSTPTEFQGSMISIGATIGIALMPDDGADPETLLRCADIAMYRSKREGRGTFRFFEQSMDEELRARARLESSLAVAIAQGQIRPHYQALVDLPSRTISGFEVLARWYDPERGVLAPDVFIPIAEDTGLITDLSYAILRQACRDAKQWPAHLTLAINISPHQLRDRALAEHLLAILAEAAFDPRRIEVEITETALTTDLALARETLTKLQDAGVSIALDDFGTGYSSLCHLRDIAFNKIKIDRSFVQSMNANTESTKIVSAIIGLGRSMGVKTTAEGIESAANREWLAQQGCTSGQGYLFGRPMPAEDVGRALHNGELISLIASAEPFSAASAQTETRAA